MQGKAGFHMQKKFSENYPQLGNAPSERSASPALGRKILKNIGPKWRQIVPARGSHLFRAGPKQSDPLATSKSTMMVRKKFLLCTELPMTEECWIISYYAAYTKDLRRPPYKSLFV